MLPEYVKFYYDKLTPPKQAIYLQMYKAFKNKVCKVYISCDNSLITEEDIDYIYQAVYNDTPSFYYLHVSRRHIAPTESGYYFRTDFLYTPEETEKYDAALLTGLKLFEERFITEGMSEYEKELKIHTYLVKTVTYDHESLLTDEATAAHREIFNALGALLRHKAVCWGIACAFKLICDYLKVKCFVVIGNSYPIKSEYHDHAWNMVKLDGLTYHVDATWDIREKGDVRCCYEYFNLDDKTVRINHTWDDALYPPCVSVKHSYFSIYGLTVNSAGDIPDHVARQLNRGKKTVIFKLTGDMPEKSALAEYIRKGAGLAGCCGGFSYRYSDKTHNVYIDF